ncbi:hypothetical protein BH10PSE12_BH10PSE12_35250 [soil metagenome]
MRLLSLALAPLVLLAACGDRDDKAATAISISDHGEKILAADGKTGKVSVALPGISANIRLPKINVDPDEIDIGGVKLYPGTTVSNMDIETGKASGADAVKIRFATPATPAAVRDYFLAGFRAKGATVTARGNSLVGSEKDGDPFRIDLNAGPGGTAGLLAMGSKDD